MKKRCIKNYYIRGMLAFTKDNIYEITLYENNYIARSDIWRPKIATPRVILSPVILEEYFVDVS